MTGLAVTVSRPFQRLPNVEFAMIGTEIPLLPKSFDAMSLNVMSRWLSGGMVTDCFGCEQRRLSGMASSMFAVMSWAVGLRKMKESVLSCPGRMKKSF